MRVNLSNLQIVEIKSKFELNRCDLSLLLKYDKIFGSVFVFQVTSVLRSLYGAKGQNDG